MAAAGKKIVLLTRVKANPKSNDSLGHAIWRPAVTLLPRNPLNGGFVRRLVQETGITEAQAWELVAMLGPNWSSLIREAKVLLGNR